MVSPRENVNRKKLQSIWWNVKNYIFGTVMCNKPIKNLNPKNHGNKEKSS
jgi:hypothetical protein